MAHSEEWLRIANTPATDDEIAMHERIAGECVHGCLPCMDKLTLIARIEVEKAEVLRLTEIIQNYAAAQTSSNV